MAEIEIKPIGSVTVETKPAEAKVPEPSHLDTLRKKIESGQEELETEEKPKEEKKEPSGEEEFEVEDVDWDAILAENPQLEKLGIADIKDLVKRYVGTLESYNKEHPLIAELEKAGITTPEAQKELLLKLKGGGKIETISKPEAEQTFADLRNKELASLIPQQVTDEFTGEPRPLTEEEKQSKISALSDFAEKIAPSWIADQSNQANTMATKVLDDSEWQAFRWKALEEEFKDKLIPNDTRKKISDYYKDYPHTAREIVLEAKKNGRNFYDALYEYFILKTKSTEIQDAKLKRALEEKEKELEKKYNAKTETKGKKTEPLETENFDNLPLMDKRKAITG